MKSKWILGIVLVLIAVSVAFAQLYPKVNPGTWFRGSILVDEDATISDDLTVSDDATVGDNLTVSGIVAGGVFDAGAATVASAATLTLGEAGLVTITGTTTIDSFDTASTLPDGASADLLFTGTAAATGLDDDKTKGLALAGDFAFSPDDVVRVVRSGNVLYEVSRSAN